VVYRNAMMARIVERKGCLITELQHQLGQPLQVLRGWCEDRLRNLNKLGVDYNELLNLNRSLIRGFDLVHEVRNNLAIYAKISQPLDASEMNKVWLKKVISKCCELMQPEAERKGCRIEYSLSHVKPIWGNPAFLRSAVINLLDNAIKYSYKDRQIVVDLQEDRRGIIKLLVGNYGVGIPEPDMKRIFQPYFRSKVPDEEGARPGSGIGLAIVWHGIVVGHAGKILVTSDPARNIVSDLSTAETAKYPHKTTFTVILQRETLDFTGRQYSNQQWRIK
jgi:signal transduction histidine kinase